LAGASKWFDLRVPGRYALRGAGPAYRRGCVPMNQTDDNADADAVLDKILSAVPRVQDTIRVEPTGDGATLHLPTRRPSWLVPPLSWVFRPRQRRIKLDGPGAAALDLCDGRRTVAKIIEEFARSRDLGDADPQASILAFLEALIRRGVIVLAEPP